MTKREREREKEGRKERKAQRSLIVRVLRPENACESAWLRLHITASLISFLLHRIRDQRTG